MSFCHPCKSPIAPKVYHAHMASHDAVRITSSKEHQEAVKDIPKAEDKRMENHVA